MRIAAIITTAAVITLAGCSSPKSEFVQSCMQDKGKKEACQCMADRLEKNLPKDDFKKVAAAIKKGGEKALNELNEKVAMELMMAAKACE
jgi:hypothetical protein